MQADPAYFSDEFLNTNISHRTGYFKMDNNKLDEPQGAYTVEIKNDID